jgi:hypothetical protein
MAEVTGQVRRLTAAAGSGSGWRTLVLAVAVLACVARPDVAVAQSSTATVGALIDQLFVPGAVFNPDNETLISQADFERRAADSREGIAIGLGNALASFPLGASSAGFTYRLDPATGERTLKTVSFGPVFTERAVTNGRGVLNIGVAYQGGRFDSLQGVDLKNDGFPTQSQLGTFVVDGSGVGDSWRALLDIKSNMGLFSGSVGVTDSLDLGWAIPFVSLSVRGKFVREYNGGLDWDRNLLANGVPIRTIYPDKTGTQVLVDRTVDASGIGDIALRAKYAFGTVSGQRAHISGELRLPTGDEENLIGTGETGYRITTGGTIPLGDSANFNVNGGFTGGGLTNEVNFSASAEAALLESKRLTLTAEFIGQNLRDTVTDNDTLVSFDRTISNIPDGFLARRVIVSYGFWNRGSATLLRGAVGAKVAIAGRWLLTGSAMFRLNDNGYQPKVVPFIGLEHTWSR